MDEIAVQIAVEAAQGLLERAITLILQRGSNHSSDDGVAKDLEKLQGWLPLMQAFMKDTENQARTETAQLRAVKIRDLALDMEDTFQEVIYDSLSRSLNDRVTQFFSDVAHHSSDKKKSQSLSEKIRKFDEEIHALLGPSSLFNAVNLQPVGEGSSTVRGEGQGEGEVRLAYLNFEEHDVMGFEKTEEKFLAQLVQNDSRQTTLAVVGPGGSGKSTLVNKVFETEMVRKQFDCRARVHVSQSFTSGELLLHILTQFSGGRSIQADSRTRQQELECYLQDKRYLVVLDDLWSIQDCAKILNSFPNGSSGSKIVVITRIEDVATRCAESDAHVYRLNPLPLEAAQKLFYRKVFGSAECPPELKELGDKIVNKCEGLPFPLVAAGALLSKKKKNPSEWKKFHDNLGAEIDVYDRILLPSYKDLPSHLKICFLYFRLFPEDYSVKRGRLIRSWIAEGLVKESHRKTKEEAAEDYLNELVGRNLVHVTAREIDGRVRSCRVLKLIHEIIILRCQEVNLSRSSPGPSARQSTIVRHLSVANNGCDLSQLGDLKSVRTLFMFRFTDSEIKGLLDRLKFVRVLDLEGVPLNEFPDHICDLILLKSLSLRQTGIKTVPESIKKLIFLETLDLKHTNVTCLPKGISKLLNLRHLLAYRYEAVENHVKFDTAQAVEIQATTEELHSLQKLSNLSVRKNPRIITSLGSLTQLKKLSLSNLKRKDGSELCASLEKMQKLSSLCLRTTCQEEYLDLHHMKNPPEFLERLYLWGKLESLPPWISKLSSLHKMGLRWSQIADGTSPLDALQDLPNLMVLTMIESYMGKQLEFASGKFQKLKILHLDKFENLHAVSLLHDSMPDLQELSLSRCSKLLRPPLGINRPKNLEKFLLFDMEPDFISVLRSNNQRKEVFHGVDCTPTIHSYTSNGKFFSLEILS